MREYHINKLGIFVLIFSLVIFTSALTPVFASTPQELDLGQLNKPVDIEFYDGGPGSAEKYSVLLATDSENYFFWVSNDALLGARCVVVVNEAMMNFLAPVGVTGDPITGSPFLIGDPLILNPNYQEFPLNRCDDYQGADEEQ